MADSIVLELYLAGDGESSARAEANLRRWWKSINKESVELRIIDIYRDPTPALDHGIFLTPALRVVTGAQAFPVIYGDLSDTDVLDRFLRRGRS